MLQQPGDGIETGHITMVMQPGFETANHVLRPAKVAVAP
jgi:molecular chaperone GrpE (heat shock protein)